MREPEASGAGGAGDRIIGDLLDVPVRTDEQITDEERAAVQEWEQGGVWYDAATITAEIAERIRREG